jgi:DNA polymerase
MSLITLDFETFYSKDYSLSKMTTEAYIRSDGFEVIGFAYRVDDGEVYWVHGEAAMRRVLNSLNLHEHTVLCHNTAFDGAILGWRYNIHPKVLLDTMSMARPITAATVGVSLAALVQKFCLGVKGTEVVNALGKHLADFSDDDLERYGEYCKNDVVITYNLYHVLKQYSTPQEQYIIDMMLRMYTDPVIDMDADALHEHLHKVQDKKKALMDKIDSTIGRDAIMSNPQFADLLRALGVEPPMKTSLATGKETYAFSKTDVEFKALLEHDNPEAHWRRHAQSPSYRYSVVVSCPSCSTTTVPIQDAPAVATR